MKIISLTAGIAAAALLAASCTSDANSWQIKGNISGLTEADALILEGNNQGYWYQIDTIATGKDGKFDYRHPAQGYPDIYRLRVGSEMVYFPIDSIETISISGSMPDFASNHTLAGSPQAERIATVDSLILAATRRGGANAVAADSLLKRRLSEIILLDPADIVAYYIVSKSVGNRQLFNPAVKADRAIIGAVANAYYESRPADPRTNYLKNLYIAARPSSQTPLQVDAKVIGAFEIDLYDPKGRRHSLLDLSRQGKAVILNFTAYAADWSPAFNVELNNVYSKYKDSGLEIYQVAVDVDEYSWKEAAKNLPWITVLNNIADGGRTLREYNVGALPTTFVINRNGEIVERVLSVEDLEPAVRKAL